MGRNCGFAPGTTLIPLGKFLTQRNLFHGPPDLDFALPGTIREPYFVPLKAVLTSSPDQFWIDNRDSRLVGYRLDYTQLKSVGFHQGVKFRRWFDRAFKI